MSVKKEHKGKTKTLIAAKEHSSYCSAKSTKKKDEPNRGFAQMEKKTKIAAKRHKNKPQMNSPSSG
jgi:hypothetical protein